MLLISKLPCPVSSNQYDYIKFHSSTRHIKALIFQLISFFFFVILTINVTFSPLTNCIFIQSGSFPLLIQVNAEILSRNIHTNRFIQHPTKCMISPARSYMILNYFKTTEGRSSFDSQVLLCTLPEINMNTKFQKIRKSCNNLGHKAMSFIV